MLVFVFDILQHNSGRQRRGSDRGPESGTRPGCGRRDHGCGRLRCKCSLKRLHHRRYGDIQLILLLRLEYSFIRRIDQIFDLRAQRFEAPCQSAVNWRDVIKPNGENNNGRDSPFAVKAVLHGKDYTSRKRSQKPGSAFSGNSNDCYRNFNPH